MPRLQEVRQENQSNIQGKKVSRDTSFGRHKQLRQTGSGGQPLMPGTAIEGCFDQGQHPDVPDPAGSSSRCGRREVEAEVERLRGKDRLRGRGRGQERERQRGREGGRE